MDTPHSPTSLPATSYTDIQRKYRTALVTLANRRREERGLRYSRVSGDQAMVTLLADVFNVNEPFQLTYKTPLEAYRLLDAIVLALSYVNRHYNAPQGGELFNPEDELQLLILTRCTALGWFQIGNKLRACPVTHRPEVCGGYRGGLCLGLDHSDETDLTIRNLIATKAGDLPEFINAVIWFYCAFVRDRVTFYEK